MLGIIIDTAVLLVIVRVMEGDDDFEWWRVGLCALLMAIAMGVVGNVLPGFWALLGFVAAAGVGSLAISALCGMSVQRGAIAAAIFLGYKIALALLCLGMLAGAGAAAGS